MSKMSHDRAWLVTSPSEAPLWQERDLEPPWSRYWGATVEIGAKKLPGRGRRRNKFTLIKYRCVVRISGQKSVKALSEEGHKGSKALETCHLLPLFAFFTITFPSVQLIWKRPLNKKLCWKGACFSSPEGTTLSVAAQRSNTYKDFTILLLSATSKQMLNLGQT